MPRRDDTSWQRTAEGQAEHVKGYTHWLAIEGSARKYGFSLGHEFLVLLAKRLTVVDVDKDGATPDAATAWRRVEGWARQGQKVAA
jgi:hypothetical protein